jgi:hypothetical protein
LRKFRKYSVLELIVEGVEPYLSRNEPIRRVGIICHRWGFSLFHAFFAESRETEKVNTCNEPAIAHNLRLQRGCDRLIRCPADLERSESKEMSIMKSGLAALCAAAVCAAVSAAPAMAQTLEPARAQATTPAGSQSKMKVCADEWNAKKAANEAGGLKYRDFVKECLSRTATAPEPAPHTAAPAAPAPAPAPAATATPPASQPPAAKPPAGPRTATPAPEPAPSTAAKPSTPSTTNKPADGRQAMYARERACGADWKADKAAGKIEQGQTWPKYWSACNARKKAEGM